MSVEAKFDGLKQFAASLTGLAGLAYATGYLVLRARARALGTDPSLALVEEAYMFAGFRFLLSLLFAAIVALPFVALLRAVVRWISNLLPEHAFRIVRWAGLVLLAVIVILEFQVFAVSNALLDRQGSELLDGVIGRNSLGLWIVLGTTGIAMLSISWAIEKSDGFGTDGLSTALVLVVTLQVFLLPVHHGVFFADRSIRMLESPPPSASQLVPPIAIVDRSGEFVTLLGANKSGERRLVLIDKSELKGAAITGVTTLRAFLDTLAKASGSVPIVAGVLLSANVASSANGPISPPAVESPSTKPAAIDDGFWKVVSGYLKNTFEYVGALGEGRADAGQIWIVAVDGTRRTGVARLLDASADYSWPVIAGDGSVYALESGHVVHIEAGGKKTELRNSRQAWVKLVGVGPDGSVLGILNDPPFGKPAVLSAKGDLVMGATPATQADRERQSILLQESRAYADGRSLNIRYSERGGRGLDVFVATKGAPSTNLSDAGDNACGQPSLSPDGKQVVWICAKPN